VRFGKLYGLFSLVLEQICVIWKTLVARNSVYDDNQSIFPLYYAGLLYGFQCYRVIGSQFPGA